MIKSGGENIYPAEIERVLLADPRVADAVVVRTPRRRAGARSPSPSSRATTTALTEADVEQLCRPGSPATSGRAVRFIGFDEFPRSTTGKIQRHEMEKWL